ncbi:sialate O-acetylesterase [Taibaiella chishuiensis]|uniref:Sialate O-acetylesterase domain-containing protein n=1 Tax=Taibaiella chishuiensis TaxID=1434707 RepID=A0A2P8D7S0_9BACT|nr:sialate O-acetylesterase [Taibaiella chishuiensis]PSK93239.1 protein of unknown function (DUF303) [Taibaiella chishuiensis]
MIHAFLMIGQSNMAGRGFVQEAPPVFDEHIKMLRNGRWQTMWEPVNYDRPTSGISLAASFAAAWRLQHSDGEIGLIPCAEGGASLKDWAVGGALFDHAVSQARLALRDSKLAGILWHQGESDCFPELAATYAARLEVIIDALRSELDAPGVPLIVGGLGDYLASGIYGQYFQSYPLINTALQDFAHAHAHCYFVSAAGLSANPDGIHFNAASLRVFGLRYFDAFNRLTDAGPDDQEEELLQRIYARPYTLKEQTALLEYRFASGALTSEAYQQALVILKQQ